MAIKKDLSWLHFLAQSRNGVCLAKEYKNSQTKVDWRCGVGHEWSARPAGVAFGYWCPYCSGTAKGTIEFLQSVAAKAGGKCLSPVYTNNKAVYTWECSVGHSWTASAHNVVTGSTWCPYCSGNVDKTLKWLQEIAARKNGKCLSTVYVNSYTKYLWECVEGHRWRALPGPIANKSTWCPYCSGFKPRNIDWLRELAAKKNGFLISDEYRTTQDKYLWECEFKHQWEAKASDVAYKGSWCPKCLGVQPSGAQLDIAKYIESLGFIVETGNRKIIHPRELDIYLPMKNMAFEYCGMFWHGEKFAGMTAQRKHVEKFKDCKSLGIRLITIFESEWVQKCELVKTMIAKKLGVWKGDTIGARKCTVLPVPRLLAYDFLSENHMQGVAVGAHLGLFVKKQCVAILTTRKTKEGTEIVRFCTDKNLSIPGAFSRLIKNLKGRVFTFSDNRWSDGGLYKKAGFEQVGEVAPSYWYFKKTLPLMHKSLFRKSRIKGILPDETEWEAMQRLGYDRIWDCGKVKWATNL